MRTMVGLVVGSGLFWLPVHYHASGHEQFIRTALLMIFLMLGLIAWQLATLGRRRSRRVRRRPR